ncbi:hypothetical protein EPD60_12275 [Flaviaesturariibacter flavus]|uniref:DUF4403 family protein n=1 Tax=Flaviaesturariibacter flavus TaxID=2502780 RepID=A0A4R1B9J1_9BACT|nr:hypothetical protein [Flaviaesturariibacter flavus]TCJ13567.1 hypothetical protein EPD60_12275 [Flaviaesturariibacter flavus]
MSYDIAIGVQQQQLNTCSQQLYSRVPGLFQGQGSNPKFPGITMTWSASAAPTFNLSPSAATVKCLHDAARGQLTDAHHDVLTTELVASALNNMPAFEFTFSNLHVVLQQPGGEQTTLDIPATIACLLQVSGGDLQFVANSVTIPQQSDPTQDFFVQYLVKPQLLETVKQTLAGLKVPAPQMPGIQLTPITATIQNGYVLGLANLGWKGPASFDGLDWPGGGFFAVMSQDAMQAVTNAAIGTTRNIPGGGDVGTDVGGADYSYSINIRNPTIAFSGPNIEIHFGIDGNVSAHVKVLFVKIGVNYDVLGGPAPIAYTALGPASGSNMNIVARSLNAFTFLLKPSGSVLDKILSAITWPITQAITAVVAPIVTTSLHNINFTSYRLPDYSVSIQGHTLQFTPQVERVDTVPGRVRITGNLQVS